MTTRAISLVSIFLAGLAAWALAQTPATGPASPDRARLSPFFGFKDMEILTFKWGVSQPVVADLNGDGLNDLLVANNRKSRMDLLLQKKDFKPGQPVPAAEDDDVNDRFGKEASWRYKRVSLDLDVAAKSFVAADLNADGLVDLAIFSDEGIHLHLQRSRPTSGHGVEPAGQPATGPREPQWAPPVKIEVAAGERINGPLVRGDLNGDKRTDLALLAGDGVFVLLQKPDGALAPPVKHFCGAQKLLDLFVADLNGDGRDDLIVRVADREHPGRVRFQDAAGALGPEVQLRMPEPSVLDVARAAPGQRHCFFSVAAASGRVEVHALADEAVAAEYPQFTYPLPDGGGERDVVAADLTGDGLLDVVATDPARAQLLLFRAGAKSGLGQVEDFPALKDIVKLLAGDLDGKRKDSLVVLSAAEKQIGVSRYENGRLTYPDPVAVKGEPWVMDLADVDGDGQLDLLYVSSEKGADKFTLRTLLSVGRKNAVEGPSVVLSELKDKPLDIRAADIDHDGKVDVMVMRSYSPVLLVRQTLPAPASRPASAPAPAPGPAPKFAFEQVVRPDIRAGLVSNVYPGNLAIAPLAPGGKPALLVAQKQFARSMCFQPQTGWQVLDQYQAADPASNIVMAVGAPMGEKGALDIVTFDSARGRVGILAKKADGTYRIEKELKVGPMNLRKILYGNFGGSCPGSLMLCGSEKLVHIPIVAGARVLQKVASFDSGDKDSHYGELAVGDVNGDGVNDVVLCDQAKAGVEILTFDATSKLVSACRFKAFEKPRQVERSRYDEDRAPSEPRAVVLGDVTGQRKTDLILVVHDRIIVYPQD